MSAEISTLDLEPLECPSCGFIIDSKRRQSATEFDPGFEIIRRYFANIWQILTKPTLFFARLPHQGGIAKPLGFALVTHWLGSAIGFLWQLIFGGSIVQWLQRFLERSTEYGDPFAGIAPLAGLRDRIFQWFTGLVQSFSIHF